MHGETAHRTPLLRLMRFSVHPAQFFNVCYSVNAVVFQGKTNLTVTRKPFGQHERADRFPLMSIIKIKFPISISCSFEKALPVFTLDIFSLSGYAVSSNSRSDTSILTVASAALLRRIYFMQEDQDSRIVHSTGVTSVVQKAGKP